MDKYDQLDSLNSLKQKGALTEEEFQIEKGKILGNTESTRKIKYTKSSAELSNVNNKKDTKSTILTNNSGKFILILKLVILNLALIIFLGYSIMDGGPSSFNFFSKSSSEFWYHLFNFRLLVALGIFFNELLAHFIIYIILWIGIGYYFISSYSKKNNKVTNSSSYIISGVVLLFLIVTIFFGLGYEAINVQVKQMQQSKLYSNKIINYEMVKVNSGNIQNGSVSE